jgi:hypothetical protein
MQYVVTSNKKVCGKVKDDKLTVDDILGAGANVEHLLASGHITIANAGTAVKATPAPKQDFSFNEEEPAFQSDNSEGEKEWQE